MNKLIKIQALTCQDFKNIYHEVKISPIKEEEKT